MLAPAVTDALSNFEVQAITIGGGLLLALLTTAGAAAALYLKKKLGIDDKNQAVAAIEASIQNGLNKGVGAAIVHLQTGGRVDPGVVKSIVYANAMEYAGPKMGDELKRAGIDPKTLPERIAARVDGKMLDPNVTAALNAAAADAAKKLNA